MQERKNHANREFLLLTLVASLATYLDVESTAFAQRDPQAVEVNSWLYGERPQRKLMYGVNVPLTAALTVFAYHWKSSRSQRRRHWTWRVPLITLAVGHAGAAVWNYLNFRKPAVASLDEASEHPSE